ncbi:MAG: STAS domain-containing protein [Anaerolineae bacterium]|nr:STAS domain-containing protein [Anaerolineae bacterium]
MIIQFIRSQPEHVELIEVIGRIDGYDNRSLRRAISDAIARGHQHLVLDLSEVQYMNSAGLRELVQVWKELTRQGGTLTIANPSPQVQKLLELVGLDSVLEIYADPVQDLLALHHSNLPALSRQTHYWV